MKEIWQILEVFLQKQQQKSSYSRQSKACLKLLTVKHKYICLFHSKHNNHLEYKYSSYKLRIVFKKINASQMLLVKKVSTK